MAKTKKVEEPKKNLVTLTLTTEQIALLTEGAKARLEEQYAVDIAYWTNYHNEKLTELKTTLDKDVKALEGRYTTIPVPLDEEDVEVEHVPWTKPKKVRHTWITAEDEVVIANWNMGSRIIHIELSKIIPNIQLTDGAIALRIRKLKADGKIVVKTREEVLMAEVLKAEEERILAKYSTSEEK